MIDLSDDQIGSVLEQFSRAVKTINDLFSFARACGLALDFHRIGQKAPGDWRNGKWLMPRLPEEMLRHPGYVRNHIADTTNEVFLREWFSDHCDS